MSNTTLGAVNYFVETVSKLDEPFASVYRFINPDLNSACGQTISLLRIRCQDETSFPEVQKFTKQLYDDSDDLDAFCLETFKRRYAYDAMFLVAFDARGNICIIFLVEISAKRELLPGPVHVALPISVSAMTQFSR